MSVGKPKQAPPDTECLDRADGLGHSRTHAGDRTLAGAANEVLCFRVGLPLATLDALQGGTSTVTLTFDAEQTANNP